MSARPGTREWVVRAILENARAEDGPAARSWFAETADKAVLRSMERRGLVAVDRDPPRAGSGHVLRWWTARLLAAPTP